MIVGCNRQGYQNRRNADRSNFGNGRCAGTGDNEVGTGVKFRHVVEKVRYGHFCAATVIGGFDVFDVGFAALLENADFFRRAGDSFL